MNSHIQTILTISGSDGTGESGVQADIKTVSALGGYAVSVITSVTVQNTVGIQRFFDIPADVVSGQIEAIINDVQPSVFKIGMVRSVDILRVLIDAIVRYQPCHVIYDPIVYSSRGERLMGDDVLAQVRQSLLPLCSLVIVKPHDAACMVGIKGRQSVEEQEILQRLRAFGCREVLLMDNRSPILHGQSNALSSAIATYLAQGNTVEQAVAQARSYISQQVMRAENLQGRSPELYNDFIDAVRLHCHTNSDVAFYADCLNVSSRYLAQVTRRIAGKSPKEMIDDCLIEELVRQLSTTSKTVQEIAYEYGFSSQAHFSRYFRKQKGMTPSAFRQNKQ
uniref:hydroxymethylpyrimidine kinase n=1 Tax=Prevotella sp. GTC17260 TaxID=3236796 RepID=A0AB33J5K6_9BACT